MLDPVISVKKCLIEQSVLEVSSDLRQGCFYCNMEEAFWGTIQAVVSNGKSNLMSIFR